MNKNELTPRCVFEQFERINEIPRPSKHEEKMIEFLKEFGTSRGLETKVDETGNVLIRKPATPGYENRKTVILQSHMDMVCEKLVDLDFDFQKDAIQTYVDGEWLTAKGTTLGADDGIGVAIELAILDSNDIEHGPIECVFTVDEETGLTGAEGMKAGFMGGDMLINLDSEDEGQIFVSCAGGMTTEAKFHFTKEAAPAGYFFIKISLKGLVGGHSGDDINKKRANAIKVLTRFVYKEMSKFDVRVANFNAGKLHNAIPRDGIVVFAVPADKKEEVRADWNVFISNVEEEFHVTEKNMDFGMESAEAEKAESSEGNVFSGHYFQDKVNKANEDQKGQEGQAQQQYTGGSTAGGSSLSTKATGVLAYLTWIGFLVAYFAGDRQGARFHLNQGLVVNLFGLLTGIPLIGKLWGIFILVCMILGVLNASNGVNKEVPLIGGIHLH